MGKEKGALRRPFFIDCFRPFADIGPLGKRTLRNVELTGAARLYGAAASDRRERG